MLNTHCLHSCWGICSEDKSFGSKEVTSSTWPNKNLHIAVFYFMMFLLLLLSHSVVSNSLRFQGLQHTRLACPSPSPRACSRSCPLSQWCHPTISSSVVPFSCLQSFPASGSFPRSQFFVSGGQSIGASALASVILMNIQDWFSFRIAWFDLLAVQGTLKSLLQNHSQKHQFFSASISVPVIPLSPGSPCWKWGDLIRSFRRPPKEHGLK